MVRSYAPVFGEYQHACHWSSTKGRGIFKIKVILDEEGLIYVYFEFF